MLLFVGCIQFIPDYGCFTAVRSQESCFCSHSIFSAVPVGRMGRATEQSYLSRQSRWARDKNFPPILTGQEEESNYVNLRILFNVLSISLIGIVM
jgi:hypothetical protein